MVPSLRSASVVGSFLLFPALVLAQAAPPPADAPQAPMEPMVPPPEETLAPAPGPAEPPPPSGPMAPPAATPAPAPAAPDNSTEDADSDDDDDDSPRGRKKRSGDDAGAGSEDLHLGSRLGAAAAAGGVTLATFCGCGCLGCPLLYVAPCFSLVPCVAGPTSGLLAWGTSMLLGRRVGLLPLVLVGLGVSWVGALLMLPAGAAVFFLNNYLRGLQSGPATRANYDAQNTAAVLALVAAGIFTVVSLAVLAASVGAVTTMAAVIGRVRADGESMFNMDMFTVPPPEADISNRDDDDDDDDDRPRRKRRRR